MTEEAGPMWGEIVQQRYRWDHGHRLATAARLLTVKGLLDFFDQRMAHDGPERRLVLVVSHAFSTTAAAAAAAAASAAAASTSSKPTEKL